MAYITLFNCCKKNFHCFHGPKDQRIKKKDISGCVVIVIFMKEVRLSYHACLSSILRKADFAFSVRRLMNTINRSVLLASSKSTGKK